MKSEEIEGIKEEIADLSKRIGGLGEEMVSETKDKTREYAQLVKGGVQKAYQRGADMNKRVGEYSHENPWMVAGIAALVGVVIGMMIRSKRRCDDQ
jgi:ElaB/YqjD/DUF883 family membrane-anchored ribosome-binding protein